MFTQVPDKNKLLLHYPASWWKNMWREALPAGNGELGAAVYGAIHKETVLINHSDLWHLGVKGTLPDVSHTLQETRDMMDSGKYLDASWHLINTLKKTDYFSKLAHPLPLVDLKIEMPSESGFTQYSRGLNMETGEIGVTWREENTIFTRKLFVSHADNMIVYNISADKRHAIDASLNFQLHPTNSQAMEQRINTISDTIRTDSDKDFLLFKATNEDGTDYGVVAKVVIEEGNVDIVEGKWKCSQASNVGILIKVFTSSSYEIEWPKLKAELQTQSENYDALLASHLTTYQPLFFSSTIQLTDEAEEASNEELLLQAYKDKVPTRLIEKLWSYGRYLFISGTKEHGQPFAMYGLWHGDYQLMWSHRMANENIQMMYWHASVGGLSEYQLSLIDYYGSLLDDFRDNAKKLYGCRGIYIPAGTTPGIGKPNQIVPVIMNWTSAAGWLAQHFYQYFQFSGDEHFLKEKILPFMREVALFYQDFLVIGNDGFYHFYPSVSPENTPANFMPKTKEGLAHPMPTTVNATMDFAIMKELLNHLIVGSKRTAIFDEEIPVWKDMLSKIPPYQTNSKGAITEWMHEEFEDNYEHRHLSHLYPIFPGTEITKEDESSLFDAFKEAVQKRKIGAQTSWSFAHMASVYARLNDGTSALASLDHLSRSCLLNNFYTVHNDWRHMGLTMDIDYAPVQMDANLGIVHAVQEMLIYVSPEMVKLLPALPNEWEVGKVETFHFCTGKISFKWDMDKHKISGELQARRATHITFHVPVCFENIEWKGKGIIYPSNLGENYFSIKIKPGETLQFNSF